MSDVPVGMYLLRMIFHSACHFLTLKGTRIWHEESPLSPFFSKTTISRFWRNSYRDLQCCAILLLFFKADAQLKTEEEKRGKEDEIKQNKTLASTFFSPHL